MSTMQQTQLTRFFIRGLYNSCQIQPTSTITNARIVLTNPLVRPWLAGTKRHKIDAPTTVRKLTIKRTYSRLIIDFAF